MLLCVAAISMRWNELRQAEADAVAMHSASLGWLVRIAANGLHPHQGSGAEGFSQLTLDLRIAHAGAGVDRDEAHQLCGVTCGLPGYFKHNAFAEIGSHRR